MNRLSPLVARRAQALVPSLVFEPQGDEMSESRLADDLKMFAIAWLGGLIFFGTYLS